MSLYRESHQSCICLQIGAGIYAVPTADAVATGEVNCINYVVELRSLPRFAETISQGYKSSSATNPRLQGYSKYLPMDHMGHLLTATLTLSCYKFQSTPSTVVLSTTYTMQKTGHCGRDQFLLIKSVNLTH